MKISPRYVKQAYVLAWKFFTYNKLTSFLAMGIIFGLYALSIIPILGLVISIVAGISLFSVQTYVAKTLISSQSDEEFQQKVAATKLKELLSKHLSIASGGFLGFVVVQIIMLVLIFTVLSFSIGLETLSNLNDQSLSPEQQMAIFLNIGIVGLIFIFSIMSFAYIYPLVLGKVYTSNNFGEAFSSIFTMFSPSTWKASFNVQYFLMVSMLHLSAIGMMIIVMFSFMTIVLIPLGFLVVYLFLLYTSTTAVLSREIVLNDFEENEEA